MPSRSAFLRRAGVMRVLAPVTAGAAAAANNSANSRAVEVRAGREALHDAGVAAASITHVVTASCTGFVAPGIDQWLMEELSLHLLDKR